MCCGPKCTCKHRGKFHDQGERNDSSLGAPFYFYMVETLIFIMCAMAVGALANSLMGDDPA